MGGRGAPAIGWIFRARTFWLRLSAGQPPNQTPQMPPEHAGFENGRVAAEVLVSKLARLANFGPKTEMLDALFCSVGLEEEVHARGGAAAGPQPLARASPGEGRRVYMCQVPDDEAREPNRRRSSAGASRRRGAMHGVLQTDRPPRGAARFRARRASSDAMTQSRHRPGLAEHPKYKTDVRELGFGVRGGLGNKYKNKNIHDDASQDLRAKIHQTCAQIMPRTSSVPTFGARFARAGPN